MSDELQLPSGPDGEDAEEVASNLPDVTVPKELETILETGHYSADQKKQITRMVVSIQKSSSFRGPLPHPAILKEYSLVVANGAERIFAMAENQSNHRIQLEDFAIKEEIKQSGRGQLFGFILGLFGLTLAAVLAILGHEAIAGIFGGTTIVGLVAVFVIGKKSKPEQPDKA